MEKSRNIVPELIQISTPLSEKTKLDFQTFKKEYIDLNQPIVLRGYAAEWDARNKWNLDFLMKLKGNPTINVIKGDYTQNDEKFQSDTFGSYIEKLKSGELDGEGDKKYMPALNIFNYYPQLKKDTDFSLFSTHNTINLQLAWIGPKGTISGFHSDNVNNMFAQIMGRKLFVLASPKFNHKMYPSEKYLPGATTSQVDINKFSGTKFPKFRTIPFKYVILEPGDVIFIPKKWWHYVESLDMSISINTFGYNRLEKYTIALVEQIKDKLHHKGLYKKNNCICH